jgi:hypothetical protein
LARRHSANSILPSEHSARKIQATRAVDRVAELLGFCVSAFEGLRNDHYMVFRNPVRPTRWLTACSRSLLIAENHIAPGPNLFKNTSTQSIQYPYSSTSRSSYPPVTSVSAAFAVLLIPLRGHEGHSTLFWSALLQARDRSSLSSHEKSQALMRRVSLRTQEFDDSIYSSRENTGNIICKIIRICA